MQSRPRQKPQENALTARDLAAAFSLQYDPGAEVIAARKSKRRRLLGVFLFLLVLGGGAAVVWNIPTLHDRAMSLYRRYYPQLMGQPAPAPAADHMDQVAPGPDWTMKAPKVSAPITTPQNPPATVVNPPAVQAVTPPPAQATTPPPANNTPSDQTSTTPPEPQLSSDDMDALAMKLHNEGLDAEARHDYAAAVSFYQQIEKLPREHWPADTEQLLQAAKARTGQQ